MKKKQMLAMLLAALMTLSVPLVAFAEGEPSDIQERSIALYGIPDYEAPILHSISVDKETVQQGETINLTLEITDDVSGVDYIHVDFINEATGKTNQVRQKVTVNESGKYILPYTVPKDEAAGTLRVDKVYLSDALGRYEFYYSQTNEYAEKYLPNELSVEIVDTTNEDKEAPVLNDLFLSDTTVSAPGKLTLTLNVSDDVSGVRHASAIFVNRQTGKEVKGSWSSLKVEPVINGTIEIELTTTQYDGSGSYELDQVNLFDENGHYQQYFSKYHEFTDHVLPKELSFTVTNESGEDVIGPVLRGISIDKMEVEVPAEVVLTLDVDDDLSGYRSAIVDVVNRKNDRRINLCHSSQDNPNKVIIPISEWEPSGLFEVESVCLFDNNNNISKYYSENMPNQVSFLVKNIDKDDTTGDVITSTNNSNLVEQIKNMAEGSTAHIYYGNGATLSKDVFEAIKGQDKTIALKSDGIEWIFNGKDVTDENIKDIDLSTSIKGKWNSNSDAVEGIDGQQNALILSFAENGKLPAPAKIRIKADWVFKNEVGTENLYVYYYDNTSKEYVQVAADLTITQDEYLEFVVDHNSDFVITHGELKKKEEPSYPDPDVPQPNPQPNPQPKPEQKPFQPSYSTGSSASGSSVTSVKSAPAASGSSIKQEEKDRLFWKNKQDQIRKAANGKKIRIFIPKETTRVPASFLESIRTAENDITVELRWNGKKITITPETALKRSPRRVFWNLKTLLEYYHA